MAHGGGALDDSGMNDTSHPEITLVAHLPLVRIDVESLPFAGGDLWRMPFDTFDRLTVGAFADHRAAYEAQSPVFYRLVVRPVLPNVVPVPDGQASGDRLQLKIASGDASVLTLAGLGLVDVFHRQAVTPAWRALLLGHPDAALPRPDWSITFAIADEGWGFVHGEKVLRIAAVQGDADLDYLITEGFETTPIDAAAAAAASTWAERLSERTTIDPALWPALEALCACTSPLLGAGDRSALATAALEALLLPEVRSGLARTLARRVAALMAGPEPGTRRALESQARALYEARSATLHGQTERDDAPADLALGPPLLAAAVQALDAGARSARVSVAALVERLDTADAATACSTAPAAPLPWKAPLQRQRTGMTALMATNLASEDGSWLMWAPLPGLHCSAPMTLDGTAHNMMLPLSGAELLSLEERDVRRDFPAQLYVVGEHLAALCLRLDESEAPEQSAAFEQLTSRRDLAVTALRLAGFHGFCDPALAGPVLMFNSVRLRRPTVLRAAVWQLCVDESRAVALDRAADEPRFVPHLKRLLAVARAPHPDLERALSLYRRGFDRRFTPAATCATLHFAALEALLGRFGPPGQADGLEALVTSLLGERDAQAQWFASQGRRTRNALAHGVAGDALPGELPGVLATVLGAAMPRAMDLWLADTASPVRPGPRLVRALLGHGD